MAITKSLDTEDENKRKKFIAKGQDRGEFTNILVRIPTSMLFHIDKQKASWQTRTTWILDAIDQKIKQFNEES